MVRAGRLALMVVLALLLMAMLGAKMLRAQGLSGDARGGAADGCAACLGLATPAGIGPAVRAI